MKKYISIEVCAGFSYLKNLYGFSYIQETNECFFHYSKCRISKRSYIISIMDI